MESHRLDDTPVLECRDISISFATRRGPVPAVAGFDLSLRPGETHGIVGESGCGKSTIALAIMRYLGRTGRMDRGQILFEGRDMARMSADEIRRLRGAEIAMIYQEPMASLNPSLTIGEQLAEVPTAHEGVSRAEALGRAAAMLCDVRLPDTARLLASYPHQISGGQQQRVVIAMALLSKPKVLLLDEPTTALDVTVEAGIVDLIRELGRRFGTSMLYISHNLGLMREVCDRITVMYAGQAVETGTVDAVFEAMRHPYTQDLFASLPAPGADKNTRPLRAIPGQLPSPHARPPGCSFGPRCGFFVPGLCDAAPVPMVPAGAADHLARCVRLDEIAWRDPAAGADASCRSPAVLGDVVLRVEDLARHFGAVRANDGVSFEARRGETVAVVGESGCGKSTLARIALGLDQATSGALRVAGVDLGKVPVARRSRATIRNLQMVFQNPFDTLNPSHTVGAQIARVIRKFGVETDRARIDARVLELLDLVKLPRDVAARRPRQLSGGQKQRVGIARAFAGKPAVVVADEPVSALDVSVQAAVTELLMDIQRRDGTTLVFISHDLSVVRYLADRVVVMYLGQVMEQGRTEDVFLPPYHPYTEALLSAVPVADPRVRKRKVTLGGDIPSPSDPPKGCRFSGRCAHRIPTTCEQVPPPLRQFPSGHEILCHLAPETLLAMPPVFTIEPCAAPDPVRERPWSRAERPFPPSLNRESPAMPDHLTLAACQTGPVNRSAGRAETVGRLIDLLERAKAAGAEIAVFPELALTTFFPRWALDDPREIDAFYETAMPGPDTQPLFTAAAKLGIGFALGYAEAMQESGVTRRYNSMILVGQDGAVVGRYRKMHVPGSTDPEAGATTHLERRYFEPGDLGFPVFRYRGVGIGLALCNDRRWPETYRMLCLGGAEVVLLGYNTPLHLDEAPAFAHLRMFHNHLPMQAGAYQNTLWVVAAAKAGFEDGQALIGGSCVIAPTGEIAASAMSLGDEVVLHRADLGMIAACRKVNFDFARYRRPDSYRLIAEQAGPCS